MGMRNGYGKPRRLSLTRGPITVRRPRVRGLGERFVSRVLPLVQRRTREGGERLPQLSLPGLAVGDFDLALRRPVGRGGSPLTSLPGPSEGPLAARVGSLDTAPAR
jgi:putative transposase